MRKGLRRRLAALCNFVRFNWKNGDYLKPAFFFATAIKAKFCGYPRDVMVESTPACNLNCALCPSARRYLKGELGMMSIAEFKKIADRLKGYTPTLTLFFRGEPFLNPDFIKMVRYASKNHFRTMTSTNAMLIRDDMIDEIIDSGLDKLVVAMDGLTKETYEAYRIGGKFEQVYSTVKKICAEKKKRGITKPYVQIQFIVMKHNEKDLKLLPRAKKDLGVDNIQLKYVAIPTWAEKDKSTLQKMAKDYLPTIGVKRYTNDLKIIEPPDSCPFERKTTVMYNGDVVVCCFDINAQYKVGNLLEQSFEEIWNSAKYVKYRKTLARFGLPLCEKCGISKEIVEDF